MQSGNMRFVQAAKILFKTEGVSVIDFNFDFVTHETHPNRQNHIIVAFYSHCVQLDS